MKKIFRILGALFLIHLLSACAEPTGTSEQVSVPSVTINCTTASCLVGTSHNFYVYYTTSGCSTFSNIDFGFAVSGSVRLSCSATSGCTGSVSSWRNRNSQTNVFSSGTYDICVYGDMNDNWASAPDSSDVKGISSSISVTSSTLAQTVSSFSAAGSNP